MWADEDPEEQPYQWLRRLGRMALGLVLIGGLGTAIYFIVQGMSKTDHHAIQTVTRITLPPPPPTPPPPPKPPEPEKVVETPKLQEPKVADKKPPPDKAPPKPQQPPASPLTAEAGTGPNAYGLGVGDGSGNVIGGTGGGESMATYMSYARIVTADMKAALLRDDKLRYAKFVGELRVWLDAAGKITRVKMTSSSGDPAVDSAVTRSLTGLALGEPPPKDMPQPIRIRYRSEPG